MAPSCSGTNFAHFQYLQRYVTYKINFPVIPTFPGFLTFPQKDQVQSIKCFQQTITYIVHIL